MLIIKKVTLILMVLMVTFYGLIPKIDTNYVSASGAKVAYKMGEVTVDAVSKSIKARKGIKIEGIDWVGNPPPIKEKPSEVFTNSMKKGLQDTAIESWDTINGKKFNSTPLKGMPKWLKVTLGTSAFLTGADIAFDLYNMIQNDKDIEYLTNSIDSGQKYSSISGISINYEITKEVMGTGSNSNRVIYIFDVFVSVPSGTILDNSYTTYIGATEFKLISNWSYYEDMFFMPYMTADGNKVTFYYPGKSATYSVDHFSTDFPSVGITKFDPSTISINEVPKIDPLKETQTLIVPNPEVVPVEDMDQLINENWDMVSNPEEFFKNNPDVDPDANPNPNPDPQPNPDSVTNKTLKDTITEFFVPSVPMSDLWTPIGDTVKTKFNQPSDFDFLVPAIKEGSCPPNVKLDGMKIGNNLLSGDAVDLSIPCNEADWWKPIATGLIYFFFGWWLFRKANALMSKHGGTE